MLSGVIGQVTPAGTGGPPHAAVVGSQCRAELLFQSRVRRGGPKFRVAPEDLALQAHCHGGIKYNVNKRSKTRACEQKQETRYSLSPSMVVYKCTGMQYRQQ